MIRRATIDDAESVFSLLKNTYSQHSLINRGIKDFIKNIQDSRYISLIAVQDGEIAGHAGISIERDFSLLNAFCVQKNYRGNGLGKLLFQTRLAEAERLKKRYTVGYAMMQHSFSQTLYDDNFSPIGMTFGYQDIFNQKNNSFNCGISNSEMVLCKRHSEEYVTEKIHAPESIREDLLWILEKMKIRPSWSHDITKHTKGFFSGLCPSREKGLLNIEYVPHQLNVEFDKMVTTNDERAEFKQWIQSRY